MATTRKAKLYYRDGTIVEYDDQRLAYAVWLATDRSTAVAFRGKGDDTPVYPSDYAYGR